MPSEEDADACSLIVGMFNLSFKYLEMDLVNVLLPQATERAEVKKQPQVLEEALAIGKKLK